MTAAAYVLKISNEMNLTKGKVISRVDLMQHGDNRSAIGSELPDDFYYDYAWHTLRQMFHLWHAVKETIPYVEKLKKAIDAKREELEGDYSVRCRAVRGDSTEESKTTLMK